jgi:hypothetical protein
VKSDSRTNALNVLVGLILVFSSTSRSEVCSYETQIKPLCEKISAAERKGEPISIGQSKLPSRPELESQVADFNARKKKLTKEESEKFSKAVAKAKEYSEKVILNGRIESELSDAEKNLVARIRAMGFSQLENPSDQTVCQDEGYLGWSAPSNSIVICPIMGGLSETALIHATAMFIGRGIGSCMTSQPKEMTVAKHEPIPSDQDPFDLKCDMRSCEPGGLKKCLVDGSDGKIARASTPNYSTPQAKEWMAILAKQNKMEIAALEKAIVPYTKKMPTCFPALNGDQTDSAVSEWFGAEVISTYLEANPAAKDPEPAGEMAWFVDDACRYHERKDISKINGHPDHETRFNKVLARNPRFRKQLNCERPPTAPVDCALSLKKTPPAASSGSGSSAASPAVQ